jgi:hypothetical protein
MGIAKFPVIEGFGFQDKPKSQKLRLRQHSSHITGALQHITTYDRPHGHFVFPSKTSVE